MNGECDSKPARAGREVAPLAANPACGVSRQRSLRVRTGSLLCVLSVSSLVTGCLTIGPDHSAPPVELDATWPASTELGSPATSPPQPEWWRVFGDPVLQSLIDDALAQNLSLQEAALRVLEAKVERRLRYQLLLPVPLSGGSVAHANLSQNVKPEVEISDVNKPEPRTITIGGGPLHPEGKTITIDPDVNLPSIEVSDEIDVYEVGLDAIWELDVWGKKRRGISAAQAEVDAAYATYADVLVSLAGEVATSYVQLRTAEDRKRRLLDNIARQQASLRIAEQREASNSVGELDVVSLRALVLETEAGIPPLDMAIRQARNALCLLLGKPPSHLDTRLEPAAPIPTAPSGIARGIPSDLLRRRADVRRAERLAAAECERIGMAKADLLPQFSLFGSIGWASSHSGELFDGDSEKYAYGGGVHWNILLYTVIMDSVRLHDARYQEALYAYHDTVLRAAREVEDGSVALASDHAQLAKLELALAAQQRTASLSNEQYESGGVDLSRVLDAQRSLTRIQDDATQVRGSIALHAIALYKALGGGWENVDPERILDDATWKALESRTDWDWYKPDAAPEPKTAGG